jgi:thiamine monophosphate kinase
VDADTLPLEAGARAWWMERGLDVVMAAVTGGEDYELLFAVPPRWRGRLGHVVRRVTSPPLTRIGVLTRGETLTLVRNGRDEPWPDGFQHFRDRGR